ncbi:MAG: hypothetical protein KGK08_15195, partial [Acidobacteriota bacterium]|nr:hypothetical protein [Acidobacteriota bacterium]
MTLTSAGVADGFGLSTVVSGLSGANGAYGPLAEAILPDGNFITGSYANGSLYVFKDVDGQTLSSAVRTIPYTNQTVNPQYVMATVGGQAYGAQVAGGSLVRFANDGSSTPIPGLVGVTAYYGMWGDTVDNHLIASSQSGIETIIASGGTRGDFVSPDSNNGTLFISQYEQVARLSCGANCTIGSVVPEPSIY